MQTINELKKDLETAKELLDKEESGVKLTALENGFLNKHTIDVLTLLATRYHNLDEDGKAELIDKLEHGGIIDEIQRG